MRSRRTMWTVVAAVAALTLTLFLPTATPAAADVYNDTTFTSEVVATLPPFTLVGMAWAPDGRIFVWQKNGVVRIIKNGTLLPAPFIDLSAHVNTFDDRGLWGLAFDPDFANNGYIYMTYVYEPGTDPNDSGAKTSRFVRVTASTTNPDVAQSGSEIVILGSISQGPCSDYPATADCIPADGSTHSIGTIRFAPDGTLFLGNGDGASGDFADPKALRAQDLNSISGKILHINKDGSAVPGNPFYDGTNSVRSKVWLYGVRNPFRFSLQPGTNEIWFGDVGWNTWEEVDRGIKGSNYGWPCYEGNNTVSQFASQSVCQSLPASSVTLPFYTYNHTFGSAAIGGPFYTGNAYPSQYRNSFFFADYPGHWIQRVTFDANNQPVSVQPFATDVDTPVTLEQGPDGNLYYLSFASGKIMRIRSSGPSANASATPTNGYSPLPVTFSSAGSVNPGGGSLTYLWDFGDGTTSTSANPSHTYTSATVHTYPAKLTVTNSSGLSSSSTVNITVGSTPPVPTITTPSPGLSVVPGQTVSYSGTATDPDDGALPPSALSWTVLLHHNTHVHVFVGGTGSSGSFVAEDHGTIGTFSYEIILSATDSSGLITTTSVPVAVVSNQSTDTTPPTAPTNLAATPVGSDQMTLAWGASTDDVGVTGYRVERCAGASCSTFAQIGAPTTVGFGDSGLTASMSYSYRVAAVDAAGNVSPYSNVATATTGAAPPPPTGLVAGYTFDAGSGTALQDVSGNGNTGSITGATWVAGKYGGGLQFDGTANIVSVPSSSSLNTVTSAMTLAAWIKPTAAQSGWRTILQKQPDAFYLNASNSNGPLLPSGGGTIGGWSQFVSGSTASPVNTWTHVALTYDGSMLRLYVNGTLASSAAAGGAVQTTTNPLWIGGNQPYGEFFTGVIDEARVYNRALSATEIQSAMNTPLVPGAPDNQAPTTPSGLTATVAGGSQINLAWTASTDNVSVANYQVERCSGAGCSNFAAVGTAPSNSFSDTGLSPLTSYSYRVRAVDPSNNLSGYSNVASGTTTSAPDTTPPSVPTGLTATVAGTTQINLSWTASTDNVGVAEYRIERCQGASCTSWAQIATTAMTTFSNTGLTAGTAYRYRIRAADAVPNLSGYSSIVSATTQATDTTKPSAPTNLAAAVQSPSSINLSWTASTDNVGVTGYRVERCQGSGCTTWAQIATPTTTSFSDAGLLASTTYRYRVRAADAAGNLSNYSSIVTATTQGIPDTSAPTSPTGLSATANGTQITLLWSASTDNVGVTGYRVERCSGASCSTFAQVAAPATVGYVDAGLAVSTPYSYRVTAVDAAGNVSGYSNVASATTGTAPPPPSGLVAAYNFDAGSGTSVVDASGNGNTGTITGATWVAGKYGGGLQFDGVSNIVQVPSSTSLNSVTSTMTLAAWIKPTASQTGWRTIMQKQADAFYLNASNSNGPLFPSGGGTIGGWSQFVSGTTGSPVNGWTHVALTYDGSMLRLYVNGTQVATATAGGAIQTTTSPLWIGGNQPYGEFFTGVIDEARVYNRALSATEIQTVMNNPL
jgi:glucose/arabinose dehydrogenase/fibronectin type 3 domain-containing protein